MSARTRPSDGPWAIDGFNEIVAGQPDYGSMIIACDGETIVAQCVAEHNLDLIRSAPDLFDAAVAALELISGSRAEGKGPTNAEALLRLALSKANGEQVHSDPLPKQVGR